MILDRRHMEGERTMKRSLLALLVSCMALFAFAGPTPAKAQAIWCGSYWGSYGRCYMAYTVVRPVAVRPVVATVPYYTVAYQRTAVPYYYTGVAYRPAVVAYPTVAYTRAAYGSYAYAPWVRRAWIYD